MRRIPIPAARWTGVLSFALVLLAGCASVGQLLSKPGSETPAASSLPPAQRIPVLTQRARDQQAAGDFWGAAQTRVQLSPLLIGTRRANNDREIGTLLASLGKDELKTRYGTLAEGDPMQPYARGALEQLGVALPRELPQLDHPVGTQMGEGAATHREGYAMPSKVALLLPLNGALAVPAAAVREGFFAAYFGDSSDTPRPSVRSYDSGGTPAQVQAAYRHAVEDGAQLVIGPLARDGAATMFAQASLPVPLLALNHPDSNVPPPPGSAEFGLLPEAEGAQAAAHMNERGVHRAIVFLTDEDRARRAASAFKAQFESLGGQIATQATLPTDNVDYSAQIDAALADAGEGSGILLLMRAQTARLLLPQLKLAGSTQPVFATSLVYAGGDNATADRDLDGVEFCDVPWLFDAQPGLPNHGAIAALLPDARNAAARLFAFGMDAYALAPYLDWLRTHPGTYLPGATGQLTADEQGHVHRVPIWATFQNGIARPVAAGMDSEPASGSSAPTTQ
ncbi:MAG TPA: penicillin-binding protein activator [Rhodanobacteraceae bacterium]|nr:penicillin-binding protein activator [Rhodanobacteraceae bacterium]